MSKVVSKAVAVAAAFFTCTRVTGGNMSAIDDGCGARVEEGFSLSD